jgi:hypothetical protein
VSINALDSLCWHLTIGKEAAYLAEKAAKDMEQLKANISVLRQKIAHTDEAYQRISKAFDRSKKLYRIGDISESEYAADKSEYTDEWQRIRSNVANWTQEINRLEMIIDNISKGSNGMRGQSFDERVRIVRDIADDTVRASLIRKHIREITIRQYEGKKSKIVQIMYVDGKIDHYVYSCHRCREVAKFWRLNEDGSVTELNYTFLRRF